MIRLAHLSDIHVSAPGLQWRLEDYLNKRFAGWVNHRWLGRRYRFRHAAKVLQVLADELRQRPPDRIVFSGDATALGFDAEFRRAADLLGVGDGSTPPGIAVPGNHDYATKTAARSGLFEQHFGPWQGGLRVGGATYPFAQRVGDVWLIGVNSASGNTWPWDATGRVGADQLDRLRKLFDMLDSGPRVLVTHYPICLASGRKETPFRLLRDVQDLTQVATEGGVSLWLHGHRHHGYVLERTALTPFPVVCSGSTTQTGIWSYGEYTLDESGCRGVRRVFHPATQSFRDAETFEVSFPGVLA